MEEEEHYEKKHPFVTAATLALGLLLTGCGGQNSSAPEENASAGSASAEDSRRKHRR